MDNFRLTDTDHRDVRLALARLEEAISHLLKVTPENVRRQMNTLALLKLDYAVEGALKALADPPARPKQEDVP